MLPFTSQSIQTSCNLTTTTTTTTMMTAAAATTVTMSTTTMVTMSTTTTTTTTMATMSTTTMIVTMMTPPPLYHHHHHQLDPMGSLWLAFKTSISSWMYFYYKRFKFWLYYKTTGKTTWKAATQLTRTWKDDIWADLLWWQAEGIQRLTLVIAMLKLCLLLAA